MWSEHAEACVPSAPPHALRLRLVLGGEPRGLLMVGVSLVEEEVLVELRLEEEDGREGWLG